MPLFDHLVERDAGLIEQGRHLGRLLLRLLLCGVKALQEYLENVHLTQVLVEAKLAQLRESLLEELCSAVL